MSYFKTSSETLLQLAAAGQFEDVAGFLVLARHASGLPVADFEPYKLSGAGINSIHEKVGVSEETARGVIERLKNAGVIKPAALSARQAFAHARWEINQGELDLDLPHAFVDLVKVGNAIAPIKRIKTFAFNRISSDALKNVSDAELRLDALMMLINVYLHTRMEDFGGLNPQCMFRKWEIKSKTQKEQGIRWGAEPDHDNSVYAYSKFMKECLAHIGKISQKKELDAEQTARFWQAWDCIKSLGLIYEAVTLFDVDPTANDKARALLTVRVNDFHAGSVKKTGDPSLLRNFEDIAGTQFGYYTNEQNEREEPEAMWFLFPDERGFIVGIWRPRFRAINKDAGAWIDRENLAIDNVVSHL